MGFGFWAHTWPSTRARFCESTAVCAFSSPTLVSIEGSGVRAHPIKHPIRPHLSHSTKQPVRPHLIHTPDPQGESTPVCAFSSPTLGLSFTVQGVGCGGSGLRFRVWGLGFKVREFGLRVWGLGLRVEGLGLKVWCLGFGLGVEG